MGEEANVKKIAIITVMCIAFGAFGFWFGGYLHGDTGTGDSIREASERIEGRLSDAITKLDSIDKRITDSQAKVEAVRRDLKSSIDAITIIEERERRNQEVIARSEERIRQLEEIIRQIRSTEGKGN